jgi:hypothetical protein
MLGLEQEVLDSKEAWSIPLHRSSTVGSLKRLPKNSCF